MVQAIYLMMLDERARRLLIPADRLVAALTDPLRRERTAVAALIAYAALWALYAAIAKSSQDIHVDMAEVVAWSRQLAWGYPKHPPLAAWLVRLWFSIFPLADWSYYLFAMAVATLGLWIAWRVSAYYLDAEKRVIGLALLMLVPFFNFHALKFNVNTVLIPLWAATTWWFLRSLETRSVVYAALAGVAAAASMLGKYWSIVLLAGLGIAALTEPGRKAYFRSAAPWVTVAAGALVLAPHLAWLATQDFTPFGYALDPERMPDAHRLRDYGDAALEALRYMAELAAYIAVPILCAFVVTRPSRPTLADTAWPADPARRAALIAFLVPILLPVAVAIGLKVHVSSLWVMSAVTLLPVVLLSSPRLSVSRTAAVRLVSLAAALPVLAILASPVIAYVIHQRGIHDYADHYRQVAAATEKLWRESTGLPLRFIGGNYALAHGTAFYLPDRPLAYVAVPYARPLEAARVARDGIALLCGANEPRCAAIVAPQAAANPGSRRGEVEISRSYFGAPGRPQGYVITVVPPQ